MGLESLVKVASQLPNLVSCTFEDEPSDHGFCGGGEELVCMLLARGNAICAPDGAGSGVQAAGGVDDFWELLMDTFSNSECGYASKVEGVSRYSL